MTSSHDKPNRKSSRRPTPPAAHDELEELEELDELEELEELDEVEGLEELEELDELEELEEEDEDPDEDALPFRVDTTPKDGFEVRIELDVGDRDRDAILHGLAPSLRRSTRGNAVRYKNVVVTFLGDAVIPSAARDQVGEILADAKPLKVTVQRGYPDEVVYEGSMPKFAVSSSSEGDQTRLEVDAQDLDEDDLPVLLKPELEKVREQAAGQSVTVTIKGMPYIPPEWVSVPLVEGGAKRVVVETDKGSDLVYDRAIAELVKVTADGDDTVIEVGSGQDTETTISALGKAIAGAAAQIRGQGVRVRFAADPRPEEVSCLTAYAAKLKPTRLTLGENDVLWPALLRVARKDRRTTLRMVPGPRTDVLPALRRELKAVAVAGQDLTFDWPEGAAIDVAIEKTLIAEKPASLSYSFAGADKEPIWPAPMSFAAAGETVTCTLDTESGTPAELIRAWQRHLPQQEVTGKKVDLVTQGQGLISRTMRQTFSESLAAAGATQARLIDQGVTEYLFPSLLEIEGIGDNVHNITVHAADRTEDQIASEAEAALAGADLEHATVRIPDDAHRQILLDAAVAAGVRRVLIVGDVDRLVHPPLFTDVQRDGDQLTIHAAADEDDEAVLAQLELELAEILSEQGDLSEVDVTLSWNRDGQARERALARLTDARPRTLSLESDGSTRQVYPEIVRQCVEVLGRRDAGDPPLVILGVDLDDVDGSQRDLESHAELVEGRRVLVVFRSGGQEVSGMAQDPVVRETILFLRTRAQAILVHRTAQGVVPSHFVVSMSKIPGLEVKSKVRDPRG